VEDLDCFIAAAIGFPVMTGESLFQVRGSNNFLVLHNCCEEVILETIMRSAMS